MPRPPRQHTESLAKEHGPAPPAAEHAPDVRPAAGTQALRRVLAAPEGRAAPADVLALQRAYGNRAVQRLLAASPGAVQRRGNAVTTAGAMTATAAKGTFYGKTHTYEDVVDAVADYHDDARTPADDHGVQLARLREIGEHITRWENKHGPTTQAVVRGFFGLSTADTRRQVLDGVKGSLAGETQTVRDQGHTQATQLHAADRNIVTQALNDGLLSGDRRLRNSCEWIATAGKSVLYALTPTGDSFERTRVAGGNPTRDETFFPTGATPDPGDVMNAAVTYNKDDLTDQTNVKLEPGGKITRGWNNPGYVAVVSPTKQGRPKIWETLRHEVQHDADKAFGRDSMAGFRLGAEAADADEAALRDPTANAAKAQAEMRLQKYKTEYRAYSYQEGTSGGRYTDLDNSAQDQAHGGQNFSARQLAIFKQIYAGYAHTKVPWDADALLPDGRRFRAAVAAYWDPDTEGFNKHNSTRVDDVYRALDAVGAKSPATQLETGMRRDFAPVAAAVTDAANGAVVTLLTAVNALTKEDAQYVLREAPAFTAKINAHLGGAARTAVNGRLTALADA
jgi:hypothetical protein